MARIKGIKNKNVSPPTHTTTLTYEQRINFIANLIIDYIVEDQIKNQKIFKRIIS